MRNRTFTALVTVVAGTLVIAGCASAPPPKPKADTAKAAGGKGGQTAAKAPLTGAKKGPRVGIQDFDNETPNKAAMAAAGFDIGVGVATTLMTEMDKTGRFTILERKKIKEIIEEIKRGDDEFFDKSTTAKKGKLKGAEFMFAGAVTDFEPEIGGADLGVKLPGIGGISAGVKYAYVGLDIRMIDVETGEVVKTSHAGGYAKTVSAGGSFSFAGIDLGGGAFAKQPLGQAFRDAINAALKEMIAHIDASKS